MNKLLTTGASQLSYQEGGLMTGLQFGVLIVLILFLGFWIRSSLLQKLEETKRHSDWVLDDKIRKQTEEIANSVEIVNQELAKKIDGINAVADYELRFELDALARKLGSR